MKTIAEEWTGFERAVLSRANDLQRSEMRKAFYAGSAVMLALVILVISEEADDDVASSRLDALQHEVNAFFSAIAGSPT